MKEYVYTIEDAFKTGLRERSEVPRNFSFLSEVVNLKVHKDYGLIPYSGITMPSFSGVTVSVSFPFPQLFIGKSIALLCDSDTIYEVDKSTWGLTEITTYDPYNESSENAITSGNQWQFLDMGDTWFLYNGSCTVFKSNKDGMFGDTDKVFVLDSMTINTGCYLNGRAIMGGFSTSDFWHDTYDTFWSGVLSDIDESPSIPLNMPIGSNFVSWSSIGGGDVLFWILPSLGMSGLIDSTYNSSQALILDYLRRNELGFMPMPWEGTVQVVKPLGNGFAVYGDNGISYMRQVSSPVPTFGLVDIADFGVIGRAAVGGDNTQHVFIDEDGYLWSLNSELKLNRLDYKDYMSGLSSPTITYNKQLQEFYISDSSNQYILTSAGLSEGSEYVTSLSHGKGVFKSSGTSSATVVTNVLDMGIRSIKQIMVLEFGITGSATFQARVHYRYNKSDSFSTTSYKTLNKEAAVYPIAGGVEFKVELKADNHANLDKLDYVNVRYKVDDKRSIRGRYRVQ